MIPPASVACGSSISDLLLDTIRQRRNSAEQISIRIADRIFSASILLALAPLLTALLILTWILSGRRTPLVAHKRVGLDGNAFWMLKLRTMWPSSTAVNQAGPATEPPPQGSGDLAFERRTWIQKIESPDTPSPLDIKPKADPRVTSAFASWCRVHSLDELPQLWHVVSGEMSLVGPRPLIASEINAHYAGSQGKLLVAIPPGITGLWQVMGRNTLTYRKRRRLDLFLVRNYSWKLYWLVLLRTLPRVISGAGAW
jgi:lipopolysaccharide/colanic/teichoic acid biosynthesis glycosyltransferase